MKLPAKKYLIPPAILLAAALLSAGFYFGRTWLYRDWRSTEGTVTHVELSHGTISHGSHWSVTYRYTYAVDGAAYSGEEAFSGKEISFAEGDRKEIWYDPEDPAQSRFIKPGPELYVYAPFIMAVPLMLAAYSAAARGERKTGL